MKKPKISIVIPVYNSEDCVEAITIQIADALKGIDYEQIMVNDCSHDKSWEKICTVANKAFPVIGISLRKNSGQDNAIFAGLTKALGEWVVIMDDDLQHSPFDIPALLKKAEEGYDCVYADFPKKKQAVWKNLGSALNGKCAELLIEKPRNLYLSPFKIIKGEVASEIIQSHSLYPYIDGLIFQVTHNITQIPIEHHKRAAGKSNYNLIRSIRVFSKLIFGFSVIPLRIASYIGSVCAVLGFALGIFYFIKYLLGMADVTGWTTLVLLILFIGGLILLSLGTIGEYLGRSYLTINKKPRFTIAEIRCNDRANASSSHSESIDSAFAASFRFAKTNKRVDDKEKHENEK